MKRFLDSLGRMRTRLEEALGRELLVIADMAREIARGLAPEGTPPRTEPRLKDSFSSGCAGLVSKAAVTNPHAAYVEFGTGRRGTGSPSPPKAPGAGCYDPNWAGMHAQPYLYPAAQIVRGRHLAMLRAAAKSALRGR